LHKKSSQSFSRAFLSASCQSCLVVVVVVAVVAFVVVVAFVAQVIGRVPPTLNNNNWLALQ